MIKMEKYILHIILKNEKKTNPEEIEGTGSEEDISQDGNDGK